MSKVEAWLNEPFLADARVGLERLDPRALGWSFGRVLAVLTVKNGGGFAVRGWGIHQGFYGLTEDDGHLLMQLAAFLQGLIRGSGEPFPQDYFNAEWPAAEKLLGIQETTEAEAQ